MKIATILMLTISCQPAPVTPDRVEGEEQTSANSCPAGSPPDQCSGTGGGTGGTGGANGTSGVGEAPATIPATTPATTPATADDPSVATKKGCVSMSRTTYSADHLSLEMTVVGSEDTCRIELVFIANRTVPRKKYMRKFSIQGRAEGEKPMTCPDDSTEHPECYYKLVTTFPSNAISDIEPVKITKWYNHFIENRPTYTIKYLDIEVDDKIKINYLVHLVSDFELDISIDGEPFVGGGKKPQIHKQP